MPRLTRTTCRNAGIKLPPNDQLLSLAGGTSLVYNAPDDPNKVIVYTIESAKAFYWHKTDFGSDPEAVGEVTLRGYDRVGWRPLFVDAQFDVWRCEVPRVTVNKWGKMIKVEGDVSVHRMRKYIESIYHTHLSQRDIAYACSLTWEDLQNDPAPECVKVAADYAVNHLDYHMIYPQWPTDAFALWNDQFYWLDPYHDAHLIRMVRASTLAEPRRSR